MAKKKRIKPWVKWPALILLFAIALFFGLYLSIYFGFWGEVPSKTKLSDIAHIESSQVYDREEDLIGKYFITDREVIKSEDLPTNLKQALIATEDARFYKHKGVDERSLLRVFAKSIVLGNKSSGGGSTITLQLAKNLYGRKDYPYIGIVINKLRESIVARRLEELYTKEEILTLYFNTVPFSGDTYGIESAAQKFFNAKAKDLTLVQSATLVGSLKANHSFNPRLFPERSQLRRDIVLEQMVKYGFLDEEEAGEIMGKKIELDYQDFALSKKSAPFFMEHVKHQAKQLLENKAYRKSDGTKYDLLRDGLKIYTTLDKQLQEYTEEAMLERMAELQHQFEKIYAANPPWGENAPLVHNKMKSLPRYKRLQNKGLSHDEIKDSLSVAKKTELFNYDKNEIREVSSIDSLRHYMKFLNTGLVSLDPNSGAVRAYIGGIDYRHFQFDHVVQSKRQVGSTFKPLVYTAALENGLEPCDYISVRNVTYSDQDDWSPKNVERDMDSDMNFSMTEALTQSLNTISVKVLRETGLENAIDQVRKMGIDQKIEREPSIVLGTSSLRLIDLAKAYTTYLNGGVPAKPFFIKRIEDKHGKIIAEHKQPEEAPAAFSEQTRQIMLEMLKNVVNNGTSQRLRSMYGFQNDLAGKTGTTQNNTDGWFVGLLPDLVTVTWVGHDNHNIKLGSTAFGQGANTALPIFAGMLQRMNQDDYFNEITNNHFPQTSDEVLKAMDCAPTKRDGFFKRLFSKEEAEQDFKKSERETKKDKRREKREERKAKRKNKKGVFKRLFGGGN